MKNTLTFILNLVLGLGYLQAQNIEITGKVVDANSGAPIEFATVKLLDGESKEMIAGTTTDASGAILLTTQRDNFFIEISFIGFITQTISDFERDGRKVNLGTIPLPEDSELMDEVVIRGERSTTEFKLDKRVFNVGQDLSSTGASALEVLNNVPSVTVNIEGQIQLRGIGGVQILINGKPSVLAADGGNALGTITADMIDRVEVITNPSAKYDAEGTSGIINIVIKKEEKKGVNGSVTLNTGVPNNHSLGFSLNKRTEKFNLFSQLGIGHRTFPETFETINSNLSDQSYVRNTGDGEKNETFFNLILGTDYHINDRNVLSLTGNFAYELETEFSTGNFISENRFSGPIAGWVRDESTEATNPKWQYELQYKSDFSDNDDHYLLISALGSSFAKDQMSTFNNIAEFGETALQDRQKTDTDFGQAEYTFKADYTQPITEQITFESGGQYLITDVNNDFSISTLDDGIWVEIPERTNTFLYTQKVLGIYSTGAYEGEKFGLKLGLRVENTDLNTLLEQSDVENNQNFTNLFPTLHSSYKLANNFSIQGGYSRRISRPRLFDLNPFYNIRNNFSIRTGNPELLPELTDSYEITGILDLELISLSSSVYHRYITQTVENVTIFEDNVGITKPMNIGTNKATGLELNGKITPNDWLSLSADFNYNYFNREGTFEASPFDFTADQWSARLTSKFNLPADFTLELIGNYQSAYQTFQRNISGYALADIGIRKKIMKGKTILNLSVRDAFASRIFENETVQNNFSQYDYRLRGRFITLGLSYGFGKGEAMEFSGQKRF
ncbi:Outer membrane receptor for ferrienterochelin and colicins [Cyclobacterium lianum]|uniref:Outer membrane receptor for ferrienterochelin and colicins n=1 Tax=Cyclobacterium lianum TaxID=388280 RepID=A0A1M7LZZ1_9BACT|nr:outer membrane beta-barrel family protein [Cyclobacterium lianum]SHM83817.1 Outer membrane receptor for ferrienterochelin and colicins [Cyclobacterium lianum]